MRIHFVFPSNAAEQTVDQMRVDASPCLHVKEDRLRAVEHSCNVVIAVYKLGTICGMGIHAV